MVTPQPIIASNGPLIKSHGHGSLYQGLDCWDVIALSLFAAISPSASQIAGNNETRGLPDMRVSAVLALRRHRYVDLVRAFLGIVDRHADANRQQPVGRWLHGLGGLVILDRQSSQVVALSLHANPHRRFRGVDHLEPIDVLDPAPLHFPAQRAAIPND